MDLMNIFLKIVNMSFTASWLVLVVMILRVALKNAPKWVHCALWAMVAVRLICPVTLESEFSLVPAENTRAAVEEAMDDYVGGSNIYWDITEEYSMAVQAGIEPVYGEADGFYVVTGQTPTRKPTVLADVLAPVWAVGVAAMTAYAIFTYFRLKKRVSASISLSDNLYLCDYIETPFILGVWKPKIYLPSAMEPKTASHVLAHEKAHIQRRDHWWKPLGYLLLAIHWFNPVMWLAYVLLCRDIELACDEKVIRVMGAVEKKAYSEALLTCSVPRYMVAVCPLAFGEVGVKERVKTVLNYKKPAFWIVLVAVVVCVIAAVCFLTDPKEDVFGKTYQVEEVVYRAPFRSNNDIPKTAPYFNPTEDKLLMRTMDNKQEDWYSAGKLVEIKLQESNYESLLFSSQVFPEAAALRKENKTTWAAYPVETDSVVFYYLMQQKNNDLYLVQGNNQFIHWVYKLGEAGSTDPFISADSPYQWTRNVGTGHVQGMQLTGYGDDGSQRHFELGWLEQNQLVHLLNQLGPDDFSLGHLQEERMVTTYIACQKDGEWDANLDVLLRYDGEAVDMVFHSQGADRYPTANSKNWVIKHDDLNAFFETYMELPEGQSPYFDWETPFQWTSNVKTADFFACQATLHEEDSYSRSIEGSQLEEFVRLLNQVKENEIIERLPEGADDPLWNLKGTRIWMFYSEENSILLRCVDDTLILSTETGSGFWDVEGYWVIDNDALKQWMQNLSYGGTHMLSEENREEVRQLLKMNFVEFFDPQSYEDWIFVGCSYDHDRGLGVACFQANDQGSYDLVRVIRNADVKRCDSGSNLYYCDYERWRIHLVLNRNVTAIEWQGDNGFEHRYSIDRHPAIVIDPYMANMDLRYRFCYGHDGNTTMYMGRDGIANVETQAYESDALTDPDNAYRVCSNLNLSDVDFIWATAVVDVDDRYSRGYFSELAQDQIVELLNLLGSLPEDAYEPAEYPGTENRVADIFLNNYTGKESAIPLLRLNIHEGFVYYKFSADVDDTYQTWRIDSPQLLEFLENLYSEDISAWSSWAKFVKTDGEYTRSIDGVEITLPKVTCFTYEEIKDGIRFKPEGEEGWVQVKYLTESYVPDNIGLKEFSGKMGDKDVITGIYTENTFWSFLNITAVSDGVPYNVIFLNEDTSIWVEEYHEEIVWMINGMEFHASD